MNSPIVIIGAGPAGSAAALLLARAGHPVTLVEQHRFPRDKVCGECLSALGFEVLHRIGLENGFRKLGPVALSRCAVHTQDGRSTTIELPAPMWGISRRVFDEYLLGATRTAGANTLQPARCERIDAVAASVTVRHLRTNRIEALPARMVIVADGKGALSGAAPKATGDFGIKAHFENVDGPRDTIELFGCQGLYGGLAAIENGRWNAAFSVPAARLREHRGNVAALFEQLANENPMLRRRMMTARLVCDWLAAPLPRFPVRNHWVPGVFPVGNAAAALEPIGGEGMGLAMRSAELLANFLNSDPHIDPGNLFRDYQELWRFRRPGCRAAAQVVSRASLSSKLLPLINASPALGRCVLRLMGK